MKKVYMADDGKIFTTKQACLDWEKSQRLDEANRVLENHITLFRYIANTGWTKVPYNTSNWATMAYVHKLSFEDETYEYDYIDQLYAQFIPSELCEIIDNYEEVGWYVNYNDNWIPWRKLESELTSLKHIANDIAELTTQIIN